LHTQPDLLKPDLLKKVCCKRNLPRVCGIRET
jgi:hypothetical protein